MTGFDPTWLALREPADRRSRSLHLIGRASALLDGVSEPVVCDLGAGTGATTRALAPHFPRSAKWLLVDGDTDCLRIAEGSSNSHVTTRVVDLATTPNPWTRDTSLVTASALFDLASPSWIDSFVAHLARDRLPLLACLSFDGRIVFDPPDPDDDRIRTAFLLHQTREKGLGGAACGPDAAQILSDALERHGYQVESQSTPWFLSVETDRQLVEALMTGYGQAAMETGTIDHREATEWVARRASTVSSLSVGHTDLFARQ
jgi:hypothetical protein